MLANIHLSPGVDTTLLKTHFAVVNDTVGALRLPVKSNKYPPTANILFSLSYFSGFFLHTILPYVTFLSLVTWALRMKTTVFFPFTPLIPWANCPNSFEKDIYQIFLFGNLIRCQYSWATPDIWWVTTLALWVFGIVLSMHKVEWEFPCLLISSWNLALPCPPLEVARYTPLVVGQGLQGK